MPRDSDQPSVYTMDQVLDIYQHDAYSRMRLRKAPKGSRLAIPFSDGSTVTYVFGGDVYWHREDTKPARVVDKAIEREGVEAYTQKVRSEPEPPLTRVYRRWQRPRYLAALTWGMRNWNLLRWRKAVSIVLRTEREFATQIERATFGTGATSEQGGPLSGS